MIALYFLNNQSYCSESAMDYGREVVTEGVPFFIGFCQWVGVGGVGDFKVISA